MEVDDPHRAVVAESLQQLGRVLSAGASSGGVFFGIVEAMVVMVVAVFVVIGCSIIVPVSINPEKKGNGANAQHLVFIDIADRDDAPPYQIAFAGLLPRAPVILPFFGTSSVEQNWRARQIALSPDEMTELDDIDRDPVDKTYREVDPSAKRSKINPRRSVANTSTSRI